MEIPFFGRLVRRVSRRRLIKTVRGYQQIKKSGQFGWIRRVKRELTDTPFSGIGATASRLLFGAARGQAALVVQQYLLTRIGGVSLNKALLYSIGSGRPVVFPLPKDFRAVVSRNGFVVSGWRCSVLWGAHVGLLWCYGVLSIVKHGLDGMRALRRSGAPAPGRFAYFVGLPRNCLPQPCKDGRSHDIVTWYVNWQGNVSPPDSFRHDVPGAKTTAIGGRRVEFMKHPMPPISGGVNLLRFVSWSVYAVFICAIDMLRGRWWHALLLTEFVKAAVARLTAPERLACDYLFHFSDTVYRPVWTYEAAAKGSRIICYFYSTSEQFKTADGYQPNSVFWKLMNWPTYLVWDRYNEDLVRQSIGERDDVRIVGPIWFNTSAVELPQIPAKSIAVFDIQPIRRSAHFAFTTAADVKYTDPKVPIRFMQDIDFAAAMVGATVVHKRKRHDNARAHKDYRQVLEKLAETDRYIAIEPDASAVRVIESCYAVISMPFTSTAIAGKHFEKPSVYYDPTGALDKADRGAHGIPVLSGRQELIDWMTSLFSQAPQQSNRQQGKS